jgi:hypothetical protein
MATIQWRPEVNALTTPQSYRMLFLPRNTVGDEQLIAEIAEANPNYNEEAVRTILKSRDEKIQQHLSNGDQVVLENSFTYTLGLTGRLDGPDDAPPDVSECVQVRIHAAPAFVEAVRHAARLERVAMTKKLPLLATAHDTLLKLDNVLSPADVLQLTGEDLYFDEEQGTGKCVIEGTESGRAVQTSLVMVSNISIILVPDIPVQAHPWNNEYRISVSTQYTEHGTVRTGTYGRMLRSPLTVTRLGHPNPPEVGILSGKEASPHVSVTGGSATADETLRIQVVFDARADALLFSLLDMKEEGKTGAVVTVTANGAVTLQGFSDSAVSNLSIRVNSYAALREMIRNDYGGRLVDILQARTA